MPDTEKEIQDAFENSLISNDIHYQREMPHIEYSTKNYIPDFTFPKLDLIVEFKFCAKGYHEKKLIAEINDDILAYKTKFKNLIFVIYDVGQIRDMETFSKIFETNKGVLVKIIKH